MSTTTKTSPETVKAIHISDIRMDGGTQPRVEIFTHLVDEYAEAILRGEVLPPPVVFFDGQDYWLADGFHRANAYKVLERPFVLCDVRQGSRREAILYSVGANAAHGLPRTNADKRRGVMALLSDPEWAAWSDREIARACRVSNTFVGEIRPVTVNADSEARSYTTKHGTEATMRTGNIGRSPRDRDDDSDPPPSPRDQAIMDNVDRNRFILDELLVMLKARERMPPAPEAAERLPKGLRSYADPKRVRECAKWLNEFADALA